MLYKSVNVTDRAVWGFMLTAGVLFVMGGCQKNEIFARNFKTFKARSAADFKNREDNGYGDPDEPKQNQKVETPRMGFPFKRNIFTEINSKKEIDCKKDDLLGTNVTKDEWPRIVKAEGHGRFLEEKVDPDKDRQKS